jgi:hypothetical protein
LDESELAHLSALPSRLALCDDDGHTTQPWDDEHHLAVEYAIDAAIRDPSILPEYLTRSVDLRWPGLLSLALLGAHPLRLALIHGRLPDPIPVGQDVLGVDLEEDPDQPDPWYAVIALEPATGPGGCVVLLSDCLVESYQRRCGWPRVSLWELGVYRELVGDGCKGLPWDVVPRLPCRGLGSMVLEGRTQPTRLRADGGSCPPSTPATCSSPPMA